jgi:hypothetical protein
VRDTKGTGVGRPREISRTLSKSFAFTSEKNDMGLSGGEHGYLPWKLEVKKMQGRTGWLFFFFFFFFYVESVCISLSRAK